MDRLWSLNNLPGLASLGMNNLGGLYRDKGDLRRAIESYDEAIRRTAKAPAPTPNGRKHMSFSRTGTRRSAILTGRSSSSRPRPTVTSSAAGPGADQGRLDLAIEDYSRAIAADPANAWNYVERGNAHAARKEWDLAIGDLNAVDRLWATNTPEGRSGLAQNYLGTVHRDKGDLHKALQCFDEGIRRDGSKPFCYAGRGMTYSLLKDWERAIRDFSKAIELDPTLARRYAQRGEPGAHKASSTSRSKTTIRQSVLI